MAAFVRKRLGMYFKSIGSSAVNKAVYERTTRAIDQYLMAYGIKVKARKKHYLS